MIIIKLYQPKQEEGKKYTCGCYDANETRTEGSYLPTTLLNIEGIPNHCSSHMHASPTKCAFKHLNFSSNKHVSFPLYPQLKSSRGAQNSSNTPNICYFQVSLQVHTNADTFTYVPTCITAQQSEYKHAYTCTS